MRLIGQVVNPRVYTVGNDAVRLILLREFSNGFMQGYCTFAYIGHGGRASGGGQWFNAVGKVDLLGGKVYGVKAEEKRINGGERFGKEKSIGESGDDRDLLAMGCKQAAMPPKGIIWPGDRNGSMWSFNGCSTPTTFSIADQFCFVFWGLLINFL
jgi:hypothetical protein